MLRSELVVASVTLTSLNNLNIVLGRNGAGKSRLLRSIDQELANDPAFNVRYISPERAGVFRRDGNIQNNIERSPQWLQNTRRRNQAENFKAASAVLLREIEIAYLRRLQNSPEIRLNPERNFRTDRLEKINRLLANLTIEEEVSEFVFRSSNGDVVPADQISSGESEAVALATEIMYFFETVSDTKFNILLLDEPDVHLHPDLQARLATFLIGQFEQLKEELRPRVAVLLATHSTALVCSLSTSSLTSIGTKDFGVDAVRFTPSSDQLKKVAPFFGHPLSLSLSEDAMLILEGEDDERVWQQAARSSRGRIRLFPVLATSVDQQSQLENFSASLLGSLYDTPIAYSLRDGDGITADLIDIGPVKRFRLHCYAIENTLLTDECLAVLGTTWANLCVAASQWVQENPTHRDRSLIQQLVTSSDRLRNVKIKSIRQLLCAITGAKKPWEVVVGQAIGSLELGSLDLSESSLTNFLGEATTRALLGAQIVR